MKWNFTFFSYNVIKIHVYFTSEIAQQPLESDLQNGMRARNKPLWSEKTGEHELTFYLVSEGGAALSLMF